MSNFSVALQYLKDGGRVARSGWNGKGMSVVLQPPSDYSDMTLPYLCLEYPAGSAAYPNGASVPWLASQTDLLSDDWILLPDALPVTSDEE